MPDKTPLYVFVAAALLLAVGPVAAKEKQKAPKASHIYTQAECTGMKSMHWDDATQTCQKNKSK